MIAIALAAGVRLCVALSVAVVHDIDAALVEEAHLDLLPANDGGIDGQHVYVLDAWRLVAAVPPGLARESLLVHGALVIGTDANRVQLLLQQWPRQTRPYALHLANL